MEDEFLQLTQRKLRELEDQRARLLTEVSSLSAQIAGLQTFAQTVTGEMKPPEFNVRHMVFGGADLSLPPKQARRRTGPRGRKLLTVLSILEDAAPQGLGFDEIISRAAARGVELLRPSLRSQLSRANSTNLVKNVKGVYYHPSAAPKDDAPSEQPDEAS